eukprot:1497316-Prymnesium_polylepis.2
MCRTAASPTSSTTTCSRARPSSARAAASRSPRARRRPPRCLRRTRIASCAAPPAPHLQFGDTRGARARALPQQTTCVRPRPVRRVLDRYFACASGDEYVPMDEHEAAIAAEGHAALASSFGLVSELAALNALHDAAASQPTGEAHDALTRQIDALELQLSAATKCVACFDADKDTILNCGHVALCRHCATRVTSCPLCRCAITERRACFR